MAHQVRDPKPAPTPSRRSYRITRITLPGRPTERSPSKGSMTPRRGRCLGVRPLGLSVGVNGQYGGLPVLIGRAPHGNHQAVSLTDRRGTGQCSVEMVVLRGRLHLCDGPGPVPTEAQVRDAVDFLMSRRTTARRLGLRLEPTQATFAHRAAVAAQEAAAARDALRYELMDDAWG